MLDLAIGGTRDCEGVTRRQLLRIGTAGAVGLSLPRLLQSRAFADSAGKPKRDDLSLILLWMQGGPSHIDTFDMKPEAPVEIRGEFSTIPTNVPGTSICEHLPKLAKQADKFSIIRSGYSYNGSHGVADAYMLSGWRYSPSVAYPCYGSVISKELGYRKSMPPHVQLGLNVDRRFMGGVAGFLGNEFNPFEVAEDPSAKQFSINGISLPAGVSSDRFARRRTMLAKLNTWQKSVEESSDSVEAMDSFYEKAFAMVTSPAAKKAFDLSAENAKTRDAYGRNRFGQSCLLARRLVESGVRVVTVTDGGWDTHDQNFRSLKTGKLPTLDAAYATLLSDLSERGMLDSTIVLWLGDFGRTPRVNPSAGRDHWAGSTVFTIGGGGIKTGQLIGQSNEYAEQPTTDPIRVEDIAATLYSHYGIPLDRHYVTPDGRPVSINDGGRVLTELLV